MRAARVGTAPEADDVDDDDDADSAMTVDSGRFRPWLAIRVGLATAALSRLLGLGGGSIIGGRMTLKLDPAALARLAAGRRVVLVSGTNGKTTTSHLVAAALRTAGTVAHNASGSNMAEGAVTALARDRGTAFAVIEVDELHLPAVADAVDPAVVVLLNLTRDQMDRTSEVRKTAASIGDALGKHPETVVVANADDPMIVAAASAAAHPIWVAGGAAWRQDVASCPNCGELLKDSGDGQWSCTCGLVRPAATWWLDDATGHTGVAHDGEHEVPLSLQLPGRFNLSNATMAMAAAQVLGVPPATAAGAFSSLGEVAGRYSTVARGAQTLRLLLAKNPAGWTELVSMLAEPRPLLISINARIADGRDTSWLWDVPFEQITARPIVASGEHAPDLGTRLSYAGLEHKTAAALRDALALLPPGPVDVVANYTAFHQISRELARGR